MDTRLDLAEQFGNNLRRHRLIVAELSQTALALEARMYRSEIGALERGKKVPRLDTLLKVAAGLGASPCVLLGGLHWRPGHRVGGDFYIEDPHSEWARPTVQRGRMIYE